MNGDAGGPGQRLPPMGALAGDPRRPWTHGEAALSEVTLHYVSMGEGPLVLLLHGFPEFWYSWRYQIPALAEAGFRVVAPSLRGYGRSSKPAGVASYGMAHLVRDVSELISDLGERSAVVVGHDWGGVVAWELAARVPERVRRLAVVNAPHPAALRQELRRPSQLLRSWYVLLFQLPRLPEAILRAHDYELVERALRRGIRRPDVVEETDFLAYTEEVSKPGALTGMLNYYRAAGRRLLRREGGEAFLRRIHAPTLLIWGERDPWLSPRLAGGLERWVSALRVERIEDVGHFAHQEAHERVNGLLVDFLEP